jgi:hypothetical protein
MARFDSSSRSTALFPVGKLHTDQDVFVGDVPGHPGVENVPTAEVRDHLGRRSKVDAAQADWAKMHVW